jgi:hypothetical protein
MWKNLIFLMIILVLGCNSTEENLYQKSDLENKTLSELRIKRNEIYAKHGFIFKSQDLTDYFLKFEWYDPKYPNVDKFLSEIDKTNLNLIIQVENEIKDFQINIGPKTIESYKKLENTSNKEFIDRLLKTISNFEDKKADTTILQICNIDNLGKLDTIKNRIYFKNNEVVVNSSWTKSGQKLWEYEIKNPYLWIDGSDEFQYDTRKPWVTFTIGIYYAIPEIENIDHYSHIDTQWALQTGLDWAKSKNLIISNENYAKYLKDFKGDIIAFGDPENRDGLFIWYEPIKDFSLFYAP